MSTFKLWNVKIVQKYKYLVCCSLYGIILTYFLVHPVDAIYRTNHWHTRFCSSNPIERRKFSVQNVCKIASVYLLLRLINVRICFIP